MCDYPFIQSFDPKEPWRDCYHVGYDRHGFGRKYCSVHDEDAFSYCILRRCPGCGRHIEHPTMKECSSCYGFRQRNKIGRAEYSIMSGPMLKKSPWEIKSSSCILYRCKECGAFGSPRKVQHFYTHTGGNLRTGETITGFFCTGCRNRLWAMKRAIDGCKENQRTINKIKREIAHARKHQDYRAAS